MPSVVAHQNSTGGISRNRTGQIYNAYFDVVADPLAVGDVVIWAYTSIVTGGGSNFFAKYGGAEVDLIGGPFTVDGTSAGVTIDTSLGGDGLMTGMGVHTVVSQNLDSVGDGSGTALTRFGWAGGSGSAQFYGGGFAALVVRGSTYDSAGGYFFDNNPSSVASPEVLVPTGVASVGDNQIMFVFSGMQDGGATANVITSADTESFPEHAVPATWVTTFGTVNFSAFSTYGVPGDNATGYQVSHTAASGAFNSVLVGAAGGVLVALVNFVADSGASTDLWGWDS